MVDDKSSNQKLDTLIRRVNALIPNSVTPSTRINIHPCDWLTLVAEIEDLRKLPAHETQPSSNPMSPTRAGLVLRLQEWSRNCLIDGLKMDKGEPTLQALLREAAMALMRSPVETTAKHDDKDIRMFLGWLSVKFPELHGVETPRLGTAWEKWRALMDDSPLEIESFTPSQIGQIVSDNCEPCDRSVKEPSPRREYHANGTYWSGVPTVDMPCDFCARPITDHDPRTHACMPTVEKRFRSLPRRFVRDISLSVDDSRLSVDLVDTYDSALICLSVDDARAVRNWLNEVLP